MQASKWSLHERGTTYEASVEQPCSARRTTASQQTWQFQAFALDAHSLLSTFRHLVHVFAQALSHLCFLVAHLHSAC